MSETIREIELECTLKAAVRLLSALQPAEGSLLQPAVESVLADARELLQETQTR